MQWLKSFQVVGAPAFDAFHFGKAAKLRACDFHLWSIFIIRPDGG